MVNKKIEGYVSAIDPINHLTCENTIEIAAVRINYPNATFNVIGIYRPPTGINEQTFSHSMEILHDIMISKYAIKTNTIIGGDFNIDILQDTSKSKKFFDLIQSNQYKHLFTSPTRETDTSATCIDNILINCNDQLNNDFETKNYNPGISDHNLQICELKLKTDVTNVCNLSITRRALSKENLLQLNALLAKENWSNVFEQGDPEIAYNNFILTYTYYLNIACPLVTKCIKDKKIPNTCYDKEVMDLSNLIHITKQTIINGTGNTDELKKRLKDMKRKFKKDINNNVKRMNGNRIRNAKNRSKEAWNILNSTKNNPTGNKIQKIELHENGQIVSDPKSVAESFNQYYLDVPKKICQKLDKVEFNLNNVPSCPKSIYLKPTNETEVLKVIDNLKISNSAGTDGISNILIKETKLSIIKPLVFIINLVLSTGCFPTKLKECVVKPMYKKNSKAKAENYRPLTITSSFSKLFERIILDRVEPFCRTNNLINTRQYGYKKGVSTIDAVTKAVDIIANAKSEKDFVLTIFLDLSKAFDCVRHDILLMITEKMGIRGNALKLIQTFLTNRQQCVEIITVNDKGTVLKILSEMQSVLFNVPQGTVLGPFLFLIYVNTIEDLIVRLGGEAIIYVDDTNVIIKAHTLEIAISRAKIILLEISKLFTSLNLAINWDKTYTMLFNNNKFMPEISVHGNMIKPVQEVSFLGLTLTNDLKWKEHIQTCISKLNSGIFLLTQTAQILNREENILAYNAHVHSHLMYGALIWGNPTLNIMSTQAIFIKQKKAIRILIYGYNKFKQSCRGLFKQLGILTFTSIHLYQCFKYVRVNKCTTNGESHQHNTRSANNVYRTHTSNKSVIDHASRMYNLLTNDFKNITDDKLFFKKTKKWLLEKEFYSVQEFMDKNNNSL